MRKSPTFRETLKAVEAANSRRVIERAALANRVAKLARTPGARRAAYAAKTRALEHGVASFPQAYALSSLEAGGVLGIRYRHDCALHVRVRDLGFASLAWAAAERARIAREMKAQRKGARMAIRPCDEIAAA